MVLVVRPKTSIVDHEILRRVLRRGRYATLNLKARPGANHPGELAIIQRILAAMISPETYPRTLKPLNRGGEQEIASSENEGGATGPRTIELPI